MKKAKLLLAVLGTSAIMSMTSFAGEWKQDTSGWWYQNDDGSYLANQWFQDFDGKWYYLNESGYMLTNGTAPDGRSVGARCLGRYCFRRSQNMFYMKLIAG